jgi:NAD(P)-dependent dehydrogenase (short-subunit alcohol dehydrogenase family)
MFDDMTDDLWFPVVETHLSGAFLLSRAVWPLMKEQRYGRLVFTSSSSGAFGRPFGANYNAAKAGILGLCNALALEGEDHGILANAILPTGLTRLSASPRPGDPEDPDELYARRLQQVPRFAPEWAVPIVTWLASEACTCTHRYYSNSAGRYAQVFVGATVGWHPDADEPPTVEDLVAHLDVIDDRREFDVPMSGHEEMQVNKERYA